MGSIKSLEMGSLVYQIWNWQVPRSIWLIATHTGGTKHRGW